MSAIVICHSFNGQQIVAYMHLLLIEQLLSLGELAKKQLALALAETVGHAPRLT
jgi:hypothetical protein